MSRTFRKTARNFNYFSGEDSKVSFVAREFEKRSYYRLLAQSNPHSKTFRRYTEKSDKEIVAEAVREYHKQFRDGRNGLTCTTVNTGFKKGAAKILRRANKRFCADVVKDSNEWDNKPYPSRKIAKYHIWDWW